jgi:hypothetical protein
MSLVVTPLVRWTEAIRCYLTHLPPVIATLVIDYGQPRVALIAARHPTVESAAAAGNDAGQPQLSDGNGAVVARWLRDVVGVALYTAPAAIALTASTTTATASNEWEREWSVAVRHVTAGPFASAYDWRVEPLPIIVGGGHLHIGRVPLHGSAFGAVVFGEADQNDGHTPAYVYPLPIALATTSLDAVTNNAKELLRNAAPVAVPLPSVPRLPTECNHGLYSGAWIGLGDGRLYRFECDVRGRAGFADERSWAVRVLSIALAATDPKWVLSEAFMPDGSRCDLLSRAYARGPADAYIAMAGGAHPTSRRNPSGYVRSIRRSFFVSLCSS